MGHPEGVGTATGSPEPDAAIAALARARAAARDSGARPAASTTGGSTSRTPRRGAPAPTGRDPVLLGAAVDGLVVDRGWEHPAAMAAVSGRWAQIVGADVADHVAVEEFVADTGVLRLRADSTAWATQLTLILPTLMARLSEEVGPGVVRSIAINGPAAPSWSSGRRSVPGRGPRDTYG